MGKCTYLYIYMCVCMYIYVCKKMLQGFQELLRLVIRIDNDRWRGVPFIILAGKGLEESRCEVRIQFKETRSPGLPRALN